MLAVGILERAFYFPSYFPSLILTLFHWRGWFLCLYVQTFRCRVRHRHNNMTTFPRFLYFSIYSPHSVTLEWGSFFPVFFKESFTTPYSVHFDDFMIPVIFFLSSLLSRFHAFGRIVTGVQMG
jgi:hypothetical protein